MTMYLKVQEEREEAAIEATIKSERRHNASNSEITTILMSEFDLAEEEAVEEIRKYDNSLQIA